jgi:hypothetical protein
VTAPGAHSHVSRASLSTRCHKVRWGGTRSGVGGASTKKHNF